MVKELYIKEAPKELTWEQRVSFWEDLIFDEIPLPDAFTEMLLEEYQHLLPQKERPEENLRAWENYKAWLGDPVEAGEVGTPALRLEAYFKEQEEKL
jgi:hypothetical protein